ncbi:MAG: phosphohydrolase, partial [Desulfobacterales bacterium]|nr:phosphohydrolase [Desulfobacterales bacterium]
FEKLGQEILMKKNDSGIKLIPMTLEGCVVRMADTISYIGRDIEDAIRLNVIKRTDLPEEAVKVLGNTNGTIIYNLVTDIIKNSFQNIHIAFSPEVSEALKCLKAFNLERIYLNPEIKKHTSVIRKLFRILFERYLSDIEKEKMESVIFTSFLKEISGDYTENHRKEEIVRDFIAGMTDRYFLSQCPEKMRPVTETG